MGVLGTVVYLMSSERRNKKSNRYFLLYLASIFAIYLMFSMDKDTDNLFIKIGGVVLGFLGIYGFLFFGVMLFGSILKEKSTIQKNENKVIDTIEKINLKIDEAIDEVQPELKSTERRKLQKNKIWYVVKDKIYDKFQPYDGYYFNKSLDGKRFTTFKKSDELFGFTINEFEVDAIDYRDGKAIVECPTCKQKCRCTVLEIAEIKCPSCGQNWTQKFDLELAKSSL